MSRPDCPDCGNPLAAPFKACGCGWSQYQTKGSSSNPYRYGIQTDTASRSGDQQEKYAWTDKQCAFNDHGMRCERYGNVSPSTNGHGPWYCSQHYSDYMGWNGKKLSDKEREDGKEVIDFIRRITLKKTGHAEANPGE